MCLTRTTQQSINTPGAGIPDDPISAAISPSGTQNVNVNVPTKLGRAAEILSLGRIDPTGGEDQNGSPGGAPTKFGKLMSVLRPALEGGIEGAFLGRTTPAGGFGAVTQLNMLRNQMMLRNLMLQANLEKTAADVNRSTAMANWYGRRPLITRSAPAVKGTDAQGNTVFMAQNPESGQWEPIPGVSPEQNPETFRPLATDQGIMEFGNRGTITPAMLPSKTAANPERSTETEPSGGEVGGEVQLGGQQVPLYTPRVPGQDNSNGMQSPSGIRSTAKGIPPMPLEKAGRITPETEVYKSLTDQGMNPVQALQQVKAAERKPDQANEPLTGQRYNTERGKIQMQLNKDFAASEAQRKADLKDLNSPNSPYAPGTPEYGAQLQRIELDNADRKQRIHQEYADEAKAEGINLGNVPDYRAQIANNGANPTPAGKAPTAAGPGIRAGQVKYYKGVPYRFNGRAYVRTAPGS